VAVRVVFSTLADDSFLSLEDEVDESDFEDSVFDDSVFEVSVLEDSVFDLDSWVLLEDAEDELLVLLPTEVIADTMRECATWNLSAGSRRANICFVCARFQPSFCGFDPRNVVGPIPQLLR
jgi:hypothetical protein